MKLEELLKHCAPLPLRYVLSAIFPDSKLENTKPK